MKAWLAVAGLLVFIAPASAALPECAGPVEVTAAHIVRTERNGDLILGDGRAAHLEGIRLPLGKQDHGDQSFADQALDALSKMANDQILTLTAVPPKEDRYDRIRAQVFRDGDWLQLELLKRGLARVSIAPDRIECANELYDAEARARAAHAGLWSSPAYAIRTPATVGASTGTFQIVQGKVMSADLASGRMILDFGAGGRGDFRVEIGSDDLADFRSIGVDPRGYAGDRVRVRGIVQNDNGPMIAIANPLQVEVVNN